jgi:hypothetical protein
VNECTRWGLSNEYNSETELFKSALWKEILEHIGFFLVESSVVGGEQFRSDSV